MPACTMQMDDTMSGIPNTISSHNDVANSNSNSNTPFVLYGANCLATNLKETNDGIARQSNIVDEIMAMKQQQIQPSTCTDTSNTCHCNFFPWNQSNTNGNRTSSHNNDGDGTIVDNISNSNNTVPDDIISDLRQRIFNLSVAEREEAHNDIYGIRLHDRIEDPSELCLWMSEMDDFIRKGISGNDERFSALRLAILATNGDRNGDNTNDPNNRNKNNSNNNNNNSDSDRIGTTTNGAEYVRSQKLKFLRAGDWNVENSVLRMALFFEHKLEYFGFESLIRDLTMKDLTATDLELWKRYGFLQLSKERDGFGRTILILFGNLARYLTAGTILRCYMYLTSIMARDETIQLAGIAQLFWVFGKDGSVDGIRMKVLKCLKALPVRFVSVHVCYEKKNSFGIQTLILRVAKIARTWQTIRTRLYMGTAMECSYNMLTYGICWNHIPVNYEGEIQLDYFHSSLEAIERKEQAEDQKRRQQELLNTQIQQLQLQREKKQILYNNNDNNNNNNNNTIGRTLESQGKTPPNTASSLSQQTEFIVVPGHFDVIMGRGRKNTKYPGNQKLSKLLETYENEYEKSDKFQKTVLSEVVVSRLNEDGHRFLIREGVNNQGVWVEVSLEKARKKVAHDFRNLRRIAKLANVHSAMTTADASIAVGADSTTNIEIGAPKRQRSQVSVAEGQKVAKAKHDQP